MKNKDEPKLENNEMNFTLLIGNQLIVSSEFKF